MADVKWTKAQESAIYDTGGTLLVSAAAGSGKTAVLVERAVQMVVREENPLPADRLLIVTFTKAAAEELRSRIGRRIEEELYARPGDMALRRQRLLLRRAYIGTMDAFCQQLVKEHFALLDIPPDIAVGDEALLAQLAAEALEETMERMYADEDFAAFAGLYGRSRSDSAAADAILDLHDFTRTLPRPAAQLARFADMYSGDEAIAQTAWGGELFAYGREAAKEAQRLLARAVALIDEEPELMPYLPALSEDMGHAERLARAAKAEDWDGAVAALRSWSFGSIGLVRGYESNGKEQVKQLRAEVKSIAEALDKYCFACSEAEFEQERRAAAPMVAALCRAAAMYDEIYYAAKLAEKTLDFADFEHLALALLQDDEGRRSEVAKQVSRRYGAVMVDEYQDTNELQNALYESLGNDDGSNLFYVGDVKQSIYRFRKANPGIFLQKKHSWAPFESGRRPGVLGLGHNFRSNGGVIDGVNFVFGTLMSQRLGEIEYGEDERLIHGRADEAEAAPGFELHLLDDPDGEGDAGFVAGRIAEMLADGCMVGGREGQRPCRPEDFCILLRAGGHMQEYLVALEQRGIPAAAVAGENLLQTAEVLPLVAALAAIDNPGDDVNLAAAMLGPLFRFLPAELAALRADMPQGGLWGAVAASQDGKAAEFVRQMGLYRVLAGQMDAGQLCEELVSRTNYLSAVAAMEGGASRRENLLRFIGWAGEVSAAGRGGLAGFVRLVQNGRGPAPAGGGGSVPGRVNVMTIHRSKGLEYPVCFLADASRRFNVMDLAQRVQMHGQLGVGLSLRSGDVLFATLPALAIRRRAQREAASEEMRVLYVALTRARERMIITAAQRDAARYLQARASALAGQAPAAFMLSRQRCMADWLVSAALCHPDAAPLLEHTGGALPPRLEAGGRFVMSVQPAPQARPAERQKYALTAQPDKQLARQLSEGFALKAPRAALARVPAKLSVTSLAKQPEKVIYRRPSFMYTTGLTAAERGTAQHSFMQFADFSAAARDLEAEIQRLAEQGYMDDALTQKLDREGIRRFLASPLAQRMAAADTLLREYDFITAIPAGLVQPGLEPQLAEQPVMLQGIVDALIIKGGEAEIADYKTDRGKTSGQLAQEYGPQLRLYKEAVQKRLDMPVARLTIWAFALGEEIELTENQ